jgi:beta-glucanase (GH16 family)
MPFSARTRRAELTTAPAGWVRRGFLALLLAAWTGLGAFANAQELPGWALVWADEFDQADGTQPAASRWVLETGGGGWGNNELQTYTTRTNNCRIVGGNLVIEARAETFTGTDNITRNFTSARLKTLGKAAWTHGRIEGRLQVPRGNGLWPAFWMLGTNFHSAGWPACGEIDLMEHIGREPDRVYGTLHGPGYSGANGIGESHTLPGGAAFADAFHVFAVEWETNRIRWYVDGQPFFTVTPASLPPDAQWVFEQPQFLLLNLAVGGNWPGNPDGSTIFPQRLVVDYVRIYARPSHAGCGGNVLTNAGFELNGLAGWTRYGANTYLASSPTAPVRSGTNSFKVFGQFSGPDNYSGLYQDTVSQPGLNYTAGGWGFTPTGDVLGGANTAWVEVSFRDSSSTILALYRSAVMNAASPPGTWLSLAVTNQFDPTTFAPVGVVTQLVAPTGTAFVRQQVVFRQPASAGGAAYFDDLRLDLIVPPAPPVLANLQPDGTAPFGPTVPELVFEALAPCAGLATNAFEVRINGVDVSTLLAVSGLATQRQVRFAGLTTNAEYNVWVRATDLQGLSTEAAWQFNTYRQDNFIWEAEDFDFSGGQFLDQPMPSSVSRTNSYFGRVGVSNVDRRETSFDGDRLYRPGDAMATLVASDFLRQRFADAIQAGDTNVKDYKLGYFYAGEWANYTRTYPAGRFRVLARLAGGAGAATLHLDRVTGGHGTTGQTTARLGSFSFTGRGWQAFDWVPLRTNGSVSVVLALGGRATLRASTTGGNDPNCFMLVPADVPVTARVALDAGTVKLGVPTFAGAPYAVLWTQDLREAQWQTLAEFTGDGREMQTPVPLAGAQRFFRVVRR